MKKTNNQTMRQTDLRPRASRLLRISSSHCLIVFLLTLALTPLCADSHRPNLVLIIADDMSPADCGAYGNKGIRTPNMDRLASEGMRFDRAFAPPARAARAARACSPDATRTRPARIACTCRCRARRSDLPSRCAKRATGRRRSASGISARKRRRNLIS